MCLDTEWKKSKKPERLLGSSYERFGALSPVLCILSADYGGKFERFRQWSGVIRFVF